MTYTKQLWQDGSVSPPYGPISSSRLGHVEQGIWDAQLWTTIRAAGGTTDDTATIQAIINGAPASGIEIRFPDPQYIVNGTLDLTDKEYVRLLATGSVGSPYTGSFTGGTVFKRLSGTGTMLKWEASTAGESLKGCGIRGITFHGNNLASTVVSLKSLYGGEFRDIHIHDGTTVGLALGTVNLAGLEDLQGCIFEKITVSCPTTATAKGITMGSWATGGGNVSENTFTQVSIYTQNGTGLEMGDSDSNKFYGLLCNKSGTAIGVDLLGSSTGGSGHCRHNMFLFVDTAGAAINSRGTGDGYTQPATDNLFLLSRGNSTPAPTIGTGSVVSWIDTTALANLSGLTLSGGVTGITFTGAYTGYGIDLNGATYANGPLRLANNTSLVGRKADNSGDLNFLTWNTSNEVQHLVTTRLSGDLILSNTFNMIFSTSTGSKIGTVGGASGQKIGFWNATPIVQPLLATGAAHTADDVITVLQNLGLCRQT